MFLGAAAICEARHQREESHREEGHQREKSHTRGRASTVCMLFPQLFAGGLAVRAQDKTERDRKECYCRDKVIEGMQF